MSSRLGVGAWGWQPHPHKIIILLENRPMVLKKEEDSRSQRLKERKSQGEADLNSQGWQLPKGANSYRKAGKSRGPEVSTPSLDYSATDWYCAEELLILLINFKKWSRNRQSCLNPVWKKKILEFKVATEILTDRLHLGTFYAKQDVLLSLKPMPEECWFLRVHAFQS
jgi:hypothetical protein